MVHRDARAVHLLIFSRANSLLTGKITGIHLPLLLIDAWLQFFFIVDPSKRWRSAPLTDGARYFSSQGQRRRSFCSCDSGRVVEVVRARPDHLVGENRNGRELAADQVTRNAAD